MTTTKTQMIRVLLVDDHEVIRVGLRTVLGQTQGVMVVGEAGTMADAIEQAHKVKPDVILMDVRLPDGLATDWFAQLPAAARAMPWYFLTGYGSVNDAVETDVSESWSGESSSNSQCDDFLLHVELLND